MNKKSFANKEEDIACDPECLIDQQVVMEGNTQERLVTDEGRTKIRKRKQKGRTGKKAQIEDGKKKKKKKICRSGNSMSHSSVQWSKWLTQNGKPIDVVARNIVQLGTNWGATFKSNAEKGMENIRDMERRDRKNGKSGERG